MPSVPPTSAAADELEARLPSPTLRGALSLFLVIHLFTIGLALLGRTPETSQLAARLADILPLAAYRQLFDMDLPYTFALNRDLPTDVNHVLEATVQLNDGTSREFRFPDPPGAAGERARHWRMLTQNMATQVGQGESEAVLPTAIGAALIDRTAAKDVNLRLRAHYLLQRSEVERGADPNAANRWRDIYQARVWRSGENIRLMKQEKTGEAAPAGEPIKLPIPPAGL